MSRSVKLMSLFLSLTLSIVVTVLGAGAEPLTLAGPVYPPPLGASLAQNGSAGDNLIGKPGGKTWTFSNVALADETQVFWGARDGGIKLSFNSQTQVGPEIMTFIPALSDFAVGRLVWTGQTYLPGFPGSPFPTRFTMLFKNIDDSPLAITDAVSLNLPATVGAVVPVTSSSMQYKVNILFEAVDPADGIFKPALDVYDYYHFNWFLPPGSTAWSSYSAGFYFLNDNAPTISDIPDSIIQQDGTITLPFTVNDEETNPAIDPNGLIVTAATSNGALIPLGNVVLGSGGNRTVALTPNAGMSGASTITITVADGTYPGFKTANDSFVLAVNSPPHLTGNSLLTVDRGATATITSAYLNSADTESGPANRTFTVGSNPNGGPPRNGTLERNGLTLAENNTFTQQDIDSGLVTYTHSDNCGTVDDFQFSLADGNGGTAPPPPNVVFTFGISIQQPNRPPVANNGSASLSLGRAYNGVLTAADPDCTAQVLTFSIVTPPTKGVLVLTNDKTGAFTYTPGDGQTGADSFTFQVNDGLVDAVQAATFSFELVNQAPAAVAGSATIKEGTVLNGTLTATDFDLPPQPLTFAIATNGAKGTAVITDAATGAFTYTPVAGNIGSDSFTFTASDGLLTSVPATFTVTLRPVVKPGDIIVSNNKVDGVTTALVLVDPLNKQQGVISSGDKFTDLYGVAVEANGNILVVDKVNGLLRVNADDGTQAVVNAGPFGMAIGVAVEPDGKILVGSTNGLVRIDPLTGATLATLTGGDLDFPAGVTVAPDGQIFVTDVGAFAGKASQVIKIDPVTSAQTVVTTGDKLAVPADLVLDPAGTIFVADGPMGTNNIIQVNPETGVQELRSTGGSLAAPGGVKLLGGDLITANGGNASLVVINRVSGDQSVLSSGALLARPFGLAVVNHPPTISAIATVNARMNTATGPINFTIGDLEIDPAKLSVAASSSDQTLIPDANIVFGGSGAARTVTITPAPGQEGTASIKITVGDGMATADVSFTVVVDGTVPVGTIGINSGEPFTSQLSLALHLGATDNRGVSGYLVSRSAATPAADDSGWVTVTPTTSFAADVAFNLDGADGLKNVYAWYRDLAGNFSARADAAITLDRTGPSFSAIAPVDGFWSAIADVNLTGSVTDAFSGVSTLTINGTQVAIPGGNFSKSVTLLPGANSFVLEATDALGNKNSTVITYNLDTVVPIVNVSTLPDGSHTGDATLNISGTASDADGIQAVLVGSDPVTINADGSFSFAVTLVPGDNLVEVTVIDRAGNQTTVTRTIFLDATLPAVTITAPTDNMQTAQSNIDISGSAAANAVVTIIDNAGNIVTPSRSNDGFSATVNLDYGLNTIIITITDPDTGATQTVKRTIVSDFRKPGLAVTSPPKDVTILNGSLELQGFVRDAQTAVTVAVSAAGHDYSPTVGSDGSFSQSLAFVEEGVYPVVVTVTDLNNSVVRVQRNVQFIRGSIVINKGATTANSTLVTIDLSYIPPAPATKVSMMQLLLNNTTWTVPTVFVNKKSVTLPSGDGVKKIAVRYLDDTGAPSAFYADTIILDTKLPRGAITINNGAAVTTTAAVTLKLAVADVNGVVRMQFSDNGTVWSNLEPFSVKRAYTLPGTFGVKKVYARFVDSSGKMSATVSDSITYAGSDTSSTPANVMIKSNDPYTTTTTVPVAITSPGPEYTQMQTSVNGTTWTAWGTVNALKTVVLPAGDGVKTVYVQFRAGTAGTPSMTYSDSIILDTVAPVGTIQINGGAYSTNNRQATLTLTAADLNGVKEMQFTLDGSIWTALEPFAGTKTLTLPAGEGVKAVRVRYKDNAGKLSAVYADTIIVDTVAPAGKVLINKGATAITSLQVPLAISAPGATLMQLSLDGGATWGSWEPYVTKKVVTLPAGDGNKTVQARFRDYAGNESVVAVASASITTAQAPATLIVPATDADGSYPVSWDASATVGATYTLEEARSADFTTGKRTVYNGTATTAKVSARTKGLTYYYRVRTNKAGWASSVWTAGNSYCQVGP